MNTEFLGPKVTVMIPCYNTGDRLYETIESIIAQTETDWEIVAVDDDSKDNTGKILDDYASRFLGKIRVVHNRAVNGQKRNSFNVGWEHSHGRWVIDLGHDDLLDPQFLEVCLRRIDETGADAIVPRVVHFTESAEIPSPPRGGLNGDLAAVISGREAVILSLDWQINSFCLWRGDIARKTRIDESNTPYDWGELESRRRFMLCEKVAFSTGEYRYRFNPISITHTKWGRNSHKRIITNREILRCLIEDNYPGQVINVYRIQTYRLVCSSCARFMLSKVCGTDRSAVWKELRAYYDDELVLDKKALRKLCPTILDWIRLRWFCMVVPVTFWRKIVNRLFRVETIF